MDASTTALDFSLRPTGPLHPPRADTTLGEVCAHSVPFLISYLEQSPEADVVLALWSVRFVDGAGISQLALLQLLFRPTLGKRSLVMSDLHESAVRAAEHSRKLRAHSAAVLAEAQRVLDSCDANRPGSGLIDRLTAEVAGLRRAMETRATIEQAKGIIIGATGCDPDRAFEHLIGQSQHENRKLADVAQDLVASKVHPADRTAPA